MGVRCENLFECVDAGDASPFCMNLCEDRSVSRGERVIADGTNRQQPTGRGRKKDLVAGIDVVTIQIGQTKSDSQSVTDFTHHIPSSTLQDTILWCNDRSIADCKEAGSTRFRDPAVVGGQQRSCSGTLFVCVLISQPPVQAIASFVGRWK